MQIPSWAGPAAEQLWSWVAVAVLVYVLGQTSKLFATRFGWRGHDEQHATIYDLTLRLQPVIAGALLGLVPLPTLLIIEALAKNPDPEVVEMYWPARMAFFSMAGAFCGQIYAAIVFATTEGRSRVLAILGVSVPTSRTTPVPVLVAKSTAVAPTVAVASTTPPMSNGTPVSSAKVDDPSSDDPEKGIS